MHTLTRATDWCRTTVTAIDAPIASASSALPRKRPLTTRAALGAEAFEACSLSRGRLRARSPDEPFAEGFFVLRLLVLWSLWIGLEATVPPPSS